MSPTLVETHRDAALALRAQGHGYKTIGDQLGISATTVRRILKPPEWTARLREQSREAKRRRTGVCEACGAVTRYKGRHGNNGPSRLCHPCQAASTRKTRCGRGHPLSGDNLYVSPRGKRHCRECQRGYQRAHRERRRAVA